jgi:glycerophosphoryl diester phosphodiesterase
MTKRLPKQLILGHRGSPRELAENTLASLAHAVQRGADGVELDVQRSRDGVPVIVHDDSLERTMGIREVVSALEWPAIARLTNARVPSFQQVAAWAAASGAWLNVEIKAANVEERVVELLEEMQLVERTIISSFDPAIVLRVKRHSQSVRRFLLSERWDAQAEQSFAEAEAEGLCLRIDAADEVTLEGLRLRSIPVVVWTVNTPAEVRHFLERGVAAIISDFPEMAAQERDRFLGDGASEVSSERFY